MARQTPPPLPAQSLYVLATDVDEAQHHELVIVDRETWQVTHRTPLLAGAPQHLSRDPEGRIWIGYGAYTGHVDRRVQVFAPDGQLLKTIDACEDPKALIHFAAGYAFIPCDETGFYGGVVVVDLASLEMVKEIEIRISNDIPDDFFNIRASNGNEDYFILAGGGKTNRIVLIDTQTLTALDPFPYPDSAIRAMLSYGEDFFMLNFAVDPTAADRPDLIVVDPDTTSATTREAPIYGALWADVVDDTLYTYHNPNYFRISNDPVRAVSRLNLATGEAEVWPLPDHWDANDIALIDGEIFLARGIYRDPENSGLYRLDMESGELTMALRLPGARRMLVPEP